jgi:hypothetical protein
VWISNQPDAGLPALKPSQVPPPTRPPEVVLKFPNVWKLRITDTYELVQILAPIDETHIRLYVRNYFCINSALLRNVIPFLSVKFQLYVAREDRVIVETQYPKKADLRIGERFIPADRPLAVYLQHRRKLTLRAAEETP